MPTRALYPMPVNGLFATPDWITLPAAGRGMLMTICEHFWRSDCRPLPRDDDQLFAIARAHRPTWRHHKAQIMAVFEAIRPELEAYWRKREGARRGLVNASHAANSTMRLNALRKASPLAQADPVIVPTKSQPLAPTPPKATQRPARPMMSDVAA
jgi:hypothetical protein